MEKVALSFYALLFFNILSFAQTNITLRSPNARIICNIRASNDGIKYEIAYNKTVLINFSQLSLQFKNGRSIDNVRPMKEVYKDTIERYHLITGRSSNVEDRYKQVTIPLVLGKGSQQTVNVVFRAFDEGIAFRYEMSGPDSFAIISEINEFRIAGNPKVKALTLPHYTSSHEGYYTTAPLSAFPSDTLMDMPALFEFPSKVYISITEAALLDYAGMYLVKRNNTIQSVVSPLPSDTSIKVKGKFPHVSPWRVILVSNDVGDFLESDMLTTLCPPQRIKDVSWIKPGKTTFPWWNGNVLPDTINAPGNNFVTNKYFIDFCARNNIQYHSVVEYGLHQWYVDDGVGFQPGPNSDPTTPVPGLNMKEVCDYAHSLGVDVRVWVHWAALYPKIDSAFANYEKWGLSGMMIDFMDRDDQEMVNIQTEMLEKAANHRLHVQFHGAYKPTGLNRTYPNEFTREGTLNYEVNKWGPGLTPEHDLDIAFTRLIAGSTDYHLGGFRAVPDSLYRVQYTRPLMLGTRCHMLALYVVFENAVSMVCDFPAAYEGEEGFDFIKMVPTTWDETKVLDARIDEYIVIARRKGRDWFLGAINSRKDRTIKIPLSFLSKGNYSADMFTDAARSRIDPNHLAREERTVTASDHININMKANGGSAIRFISR